MSETTTTAREGIQTLGTVGAEPVGWDGCEDMPEAYGHACVELTAEALTRAGMLVLGALGDAAALEDATPGAGQYVAPRETLGLR